MGRHHIQDQSLDPETKETKHVVIQMILLAQLCWSGTQGGGAGVWGGDQPQSLMCHYKHRNRRAAVPTDVEPLLFLQRHLRSGLAPRQASVVFGSDYPLTQPVLL